ncbi:MAG: metallophosphoesterase, partial [Saprospiraceae bacterium]
LEYRDSTLVTTATKYQNRNEIDLHCTVSKTHDHFSFRLHDTLLVEPDTYALPAQMLVLSDIEGDFEAFKIMLVGARVMDRQFRWIYGAGHLVLVGDYFDRGLNVTECLWLIYKLETEAAAAGGKVHFILGNHEVLNLEGNTQYMRQKYVENVALIQEDYIRWYDNNSELGRWLRTKNALEKIGDYVFCHGGISPELARSGLNFHEVNNISRHYLGKPNADIVNPDAKLVFDVKYGIFWYRGAAKNLLSEEEVNLVLNYAGAKRMVIGHTLQSDVTGLYSGRVVCVDLYHEENVRQGFVKTLYIENGLCFALDSRGEKSSIYAVAFSKKQN